jgi:septal ring factor EnvC (AmiA/AmiB activator)
LTLLLEDSEAAGRIVDQIVEISVRLSPVVDAPPVQPEPSAQPDEEQLRLLGQYQERIEVLEGENTRLADQLKSLQAREQSLQNENGRLTAALERFEAQESSLESSVFRTRGKP